MRSWYTRPLTLSLQESSITFLLSQARRSLSSECPFSIAWSFSSQFDWNSRLPIAGERVASRMHLRAVHPSRCIHREAIDRDAAWWYWQFMIPDLTRYIAFFWRSFLFFFLFLSGICASTHAMTRQPDWNYLGVKLTFRILVGRTIDEDHRGRRFAYSTIFRWAGFWKMLLGE